MCKCILCLIAGGYLFAVVDPLETMVQFGVRITPGGETLNNLTLYYSRPENRFGSQVRANS